MKCPYCGQNDDRVVDSRESRDGETIRRRRQCNHCEHRFTSYEQIEDIPYMVVKNDGSRQEFSRSKVMAGLLRACEKRPVSVSQLEELVDALEQSLHQTTERELSTQDIGSFIMERLKELDQVAYIRFASVYRRFEDVDAFMEMVRSLPTRKTPEPSAEDDARIKT